MSAADNDDLLALTTATGCSLEDAEALLAASEGNVEEAARVYYDNQSGSVRPTKRPKQRKKTARAQSPAAGLSSRQRPAAASAGVTEYNRTDPAGQVQMVAEQQLISMGIQNARARAACAHSNGNVEEAIDFVLRRSAESDEWWEGLSLAHPHPPSSQGEPVKRMEGAPVNGEGEQVPRKRQTTEHYVPGTGGGLRHAATKSTTNRPAQAQQPISAEPCPLVGRRVMYDSGDQWVTGTIRGWEVRHESSCPAGNKKKGRKVLTCNCSRPRVPPLDPDALDRGWVVVRRDAHCPCAGRDENVNMNTTKYTIWCGKVRAEPPGLLLLCNSVQQRSDHVSLCTAAKDSTLHGS